MKTFTIDEDLEKILLRIGNTFGHKDLNQTILNGFTFLRFLEEVEKEEAILMLQDSEGKLIKLPIKELMNLESKQEQKKESKPQKRQKKTKAKVLR